MMSSGVAQRPGVRGASTNPLFNDNRLKLGTFATNASGGCAMTSAEGGLQASWPTTLRLAELVDRSGMEAIVPIARWKGFGGQTNFNSSVFETYTWAAGIAQATHDAGVFATSHVPTVHPIMAAKQAVTIDHISGGRFALNIVCGWFQPELEMFGAPIMPQATRYEYAAEWLEVVKKLWTAEDEWDFQGEFFKIDRGFAEPKPIQQPFPPIMNAGTSDIGRRFAARHADMAFTILTRQDYDGARAKAEDIRALAREFGREVQVWINGYVVCAPTEKEARDYLHYYVREKGDWDGVDNLVRVMGIQTGGMPPAIADAMKAEFIAGWGGYPLVGTPEQITDELQHLSSAGIDGCLLSWVDYAAGLEQWGREVMPLIEQAGLRKPSGGGHQ